MSIDMGPGMTSAVTADARAQVRRWRGPLILVIVVVLTSVVLALAQGRNSRGYLDPDAVDPSGAGALAALLEEQGVDVVRVTTAEAARNALYEATGTKTLLVAAGLAPISDRMIDVVQEQRSNHVVLVDADPTLLPAFAPWADVASGTPSKDEVPPDCSWDVAQRVGPLSNLGFLYSSGQLAASVCWGGFVLDLPPQPGEEGVTLIGAGDGFTNDLLADSGNAALGLNVLGRDSTVVWWLPSLADPLQFDDGAEGVALSDLVPSWVGIAVAQVFAAVLFTVWWRGRRLGRVVIEPLPVTVRATEAVEGRARLYRRAGDRGRAADVLRAAAVARISSLLRLPRSADLTEVVPAVVARTGRDAIDVAALLTPGAAPTDDASLSRLADALDTLEDEVRRS